MNFAFSGFCFESLTSSLLLASGLTYTKILTWRSRLADCSL